MQFKFYFALQHHGVPYLIVFLCPEEVGIITGKCKRFKILSILLFRYHKFLFYNSFQKNSQIPINLKCLASVVQSSVLCLSPFLKAMKLYKGICSTLISRTSAKNFFSQIDVINVSKIKQIYCYFTKNISMDFQKVSS